jgi:hypothetical protein
MSFEQKAKIVILLLELGNPLLVHVLEHFALLFRQVRALQRLVSLRNDPVEARLLGLVCRVVRSLERFDQLLVAS